MTTLYPLDFHRCVEGRWAERMKSAADARGFMAHGRLAGERGNEVRDAWDAAGKDSHGGHGSRAWDVRRSLADPLGTTKSAPLRLPNVS